MKIWMIVFCMLALPSLAWCDDALWDPALEERAVILGQELRCVVCQSESINDSEADMAQDMRHLVREKLSQGWSDQQILNFMKTRYGDFILLDPPIQANTYLLWGLPLIFLGSAGGIAACVLKLRKGPV